MVSWMSYQLKKIKAFILLSFLCVTGLWCSENIEQNAPSFHAIRELRIPLGRKCASVACHHINYKGTAKNVLLDVPLWAQYIG
jgi:hypothetical protein